MRILVIRNDKLGDFMLAWPALALLKSQYPDFTIIALVPAYTREMALLCPSIDEVMVDAHRNGSLVSNATRLADDIRASSIDASLSLYSEMRTSVALWLARVPQRLGPATKLSQLFLNQRLRQRRSTSAKPEYIYNIDLVIDFIRRHGDTPVPQPKPPYLSFDAATLSKARQAYMSTHGIPANYRLIIIHPGSGGSAINLTLQQYTQLATRLSERQQVHFIITAGPDELAHAEQLAETMRSLNPTVYHSTHGLVEFSRFIAIADLFISGSTGPLHIAGALNIRTAAFYPARRSATALRWQTTNAEDRRLAFSPAEFRGEHDMQTIDVDASARAIHDAFGHTV